MDVYLVSSIMQQERGITASKRKIQENETFQNSFLSFISKRPCPMPCDDANNSIFTRERELNTHRKKVIPSHSNGIHGKCTINTTKRVRSKKKTLISESKSVVAVDLIPTKNTEVSQKKLAPIFIKKSKLDIPEDFEHCSETRTEKLAPIFVHSKKNHRIFTIKEDNLKVSYSLPQTPRIEVNNVKHSHCENKAVGEKNLPIIAINMESPTADRVPSISKQRFASIFLRSHSSKNTKCDNKSSASISEQSHKSTTKCRLSTTKLGNRALPQIKMAPLFTKYRANGITSSRAHMPVIESTVSHEEVLCISHVNNADKVVSDLKQYKYVQSPSVISENCQSFFPKVSHVQQAVEECVEPSFHLKFPFKSSLNYVSYFSPDSISISWNNYLGLSIFDHINPTQCLALGDQLDCRICDKLQNVLNENRCHIQNNWSKQSSSCKLCSRNGIQNTANSHLEHISVRRKNKGYETENAEFHNSELMWTDKYMPLDCGKVVGNDKAVLTLNSWLKEWKQRRSKERCEDMEIKDFADEWSLSSDDEDINNCILITGPPGSGKTSMVYSIAHDLGFKVLEVNASSSRSGRHITSKLQEATQSHHVERAELYSAENSQKSMHYYKSTTFSETPLDIDNAMFCRDASKKCGSTKKSMNICNTSNCPEKKRHSFKHVKLVSSKKNSEIIKMKQEAVMHILQGKKGHNYASNSFDTIKKTVKEPTKSFKGAYENQICQADLISQNKGLRISTLSLILFDDVDIVFDNDDGFWNAVNSFLRKTKKPVILTASRNIHQITNNLNNRFEIVTLTLPPVESVASHLHRICSTENVSVTPSEITSFLEFMGQDIRKAFLHLQFWGMEVDKVLNLEEKKMEKKLRRKSLGEMLQFNLEFQNADEEMQVLSSHTNMPNSLIGVCLKNSKCFLHVLLDGNFWTAVNMVTHYHNVGVDVIYCNLPNLLPLPYYLHIPVQKYKTDEDSKSCIKNSLDISWLSEETVSHNSSETVVQKEKVPQSDFSSIVALNCLCYMSELADDISISDLLRTKMCNEKDAWSPREQLKKWNAGIPICINENVSSVEAISLELISITELLSLRKAIKNIKKEISPKSHKLVSLTIPTRDLSSKLHLSRENDELCRNEQQHMCFTSVASSLPLCQRLNHGAIRVDYLSVIKKLCQFEAQRKTKSGKRCGRFHHYLNSIGLDMGQSVISALQQYIFVV